MAEILLLANAQRLAELSEDRMAFLSQEHERLGLPGEKNRVLEELERGRWERTETQRKAEKLERERSETKAKDEGRLWRG